jgi:drug/metabolite transporter (DMT)-like permease
MLWNPSATDLTHWGYTDWLALSSGMAFAATNVTVRKAQELAIWSKSVVTWIGVSVLAAILILTLDVKMPQVAPEVYGYAALLGIFGMVIMTLSVQYGVTHMPVQYSSIILLFELVAGSLSSQLLTDEQVLFQEWLGGAMIIFAAVIVATQVTGRQR